MDEATVSSVIIGVVGAVAGSLTTLFIRNKRENNKQDLAENEQAFALYKSLVETLEIRIIEIEKQNLICEKENVRLKAQIEGLQLKVETMENQLKKT